MEFRKTLWGDHQLEKVELERLEAGVERGKIGATSCIRSLPDGKLILNAAESRCVGRLYAV
jgi:hypothetical protein